VIDPNMRSSHNGKPRIEQKVHERTDQNPIKCLGSFNEMKYHWKVNIYFAGRSNVLSGLSASRDVLYFDTIVLLMYLTACVSVLSSNRDFRSSRNCSGGVYIAR
jgi:hypothetical protein